MPRDNKTLDLIILHRSPRVTGFALNIIKALSKELTIGVVNHDYYKKLINTEILFLETCQKLGAQILDVESNYTCHVFLVNQVADKHLMDIAKRIKYHKIIGYVTSGTKENLENYKDLNVKDLWVRSKSMIVSEWEKERCLDLVDEFEITEVGVPCARYPALDFSSLKIDYLIAYPTPMLMRDPKVIIPLFENMISLIEKIPEDKSIYIKLHNVKDGGYDYTNRRLLRLATKMAPGLLNCGTRHLHSLLSKTGLNGIISQKAINLRVYTLACLLRYRKKSLSDITQFSNFGIEHFLPFVREGVITGISVCLWHGLYNKLSVYNCDDRPMGRVVRDFPHYGSFNIPPCKGELVFNPSFYDCISDDCRRADMIEILKGEF